MKSTQIIIGNVLLLFALIGSNANAAGRDHIEIVGSSTVYPFSTVVAETFGKKSKFKTPKIESTGSGGGLKLFCSGSGIDTPDITNSSRRIKKSEVELCNANGVTEITEVQIGFDGIAVANSITGKDFTLSLTDIYLALAKEVPSENEGELIENPYKTWSQVNPELPDLEIEVLGPPPTSGTRDAFVELAMEGGCKTFTSIKAMKKTDKQKYKSVCHTIREDGAFVEVGENDNLIVQKLEKNPDALGIFGFSFLDQNSDKVKGANIDGADITFDNIADGSYPVSRPLYFYVKNGHVGKVPGLTEFVAEFTDEETWGDEGYLTDKGLIPLDEDTRNEIGESARNFKPFVLD